MMVPIGNVKITGRIQGNTFGAVERSGSRRLAVSHPVTRATSAGDCRRNTVWIYFLYNAGKMGRHINIAARINGYIVRAS